MHRLPPFRQPLVATAVMLAALACLSPAQAADPLIAVSAEQARLLGIRHTPALAADSIPLQHLPATLEPPLDRSAVVTAPYAGTVTRVLAVEGDEVAAGTPLARVQSREYLALQADAARDASAAQLARSQARRDAELLTEGIIAAARAEASRAAATQAAAAQAQTARALALAPQATDGAPGEYELRAPLAGTVLERRVVPGQALEALATAFVVADAGSLDASVRVPAELRGRIRSGTSAQVEGTDATGQVLAVGHAVDAASQTIPVRLRLDAAGTLAPGQPVNVTLALPAPTGSVRLPRSAVVHQGDATVVFVATTGGYQPVTVELLGSSASDAIVHGAIAVDAPVASSGTSALKALLAPAE